MTRHGNLCTLKRIATVLFALADLAERASVRPWPVLCLVLCVLRPAEAVARQFVVDVSPPELVVAPPSDSSAFGAAGASLEALRLAAVFRLLAAVLCGVAAAGAMAFGPSLRRRREAHGSPAGAKIARRAPEFSDTS